MARRTAKRDSRDYIDWIEHANEDFLAASILINNEDCYNACAFHCQQCIEKALKAYILLFQHRLVDGHNLTWLCRQAVQQDNTFREWMDESVALNRWYIETRYPTDIGEEITEKQVRSAHEMAKRMYRFIYDKISEESERI